MIGRKIVLLLACIVGIGNANASDLKFYTHFLKPFSWQDEGRFEGMAVEVVSEMMKVMGVDIKFYDIPFARGLHQVQNGEKTALFIVARRPEREDTVKWVGPIATDEVFVYKNKNMYFEINDLDDLKGLRAVGVGRGNADHVFLEDMGFDNLYATTNQQQSLQMLVSNRIDATPMGRMVMIPTALEAGIDLQVIERTSLKLYDNLLFLAFSKDISDEEVVKWQEAFEEVKSSGRYQEIEDKYIQ